MFIVREFLVESGFWSRHLGGSDFGSRGLDSGCTLPLATTTLISCFARCSEHLRHRPPGEEVQSKWLQIGRFEDCWKSGGPHDKDPTLLRRLRRCNH